MPDDVRLSSTEVFQAPHPPAKGRLEEAMAADVERRPRDGRKFSRLTLRILAITIFPVTTMFGGLMYLGAYERSLIEAEVTALGTQARIIAGALGESAVPRGVPDETKINQETARQVVRRLVRPTRVRARLFGRNGKLLADSRVLLRPGGAIRSEKLSPPSSGSWVLRNLGSAYDWFFLLLAKGRDTTPVYREKPYESASDYVEVGSALRGDAKGYVRRVERGGHLILSFAVPVQRYKSIHGALMLTMPSIDIDRNVREVRRDIVQVVAVVLVLSVLLALYLARAIARPIKKLANAAETMRKVRSRAVPMPLFEDRRDEIGDLSGSLRDLTTELWDRMDAIESFAADVSHELKNPLSSLRSAVETVDRVENPEQKKKLMAVIQHDVDRLDRLITDIARASRIDAEMLRVSPTPVDIRGLLKILCDMYMTTATEDKPTIQLDLPARGDLIVRALEDRLIQVLQNLIANAVSFSPPDGIITVGARAERRHVVVTVEDQGGGIPDGKQTDIFKRFYTERPVGEKFGQHSGLGLSISKQIVEAVGGSIHAENITENGKPDGKVEGARFVIRLQRLTKSGSRIPREANSSPSDLKKNS